jgi:[ribosomal protein S18]-alanine N-acetyltransferase
MASLPRYLSHAEVVWRPLADNDIAYVAALEAQIHAAPWTSENFREALAAGYSARVGEREGRIIAYGVLMRAPGEAQLLNLSVVPDARRSGLGSELLAQFLADAKVLGAEQVFLEVRESNEPAIALYVRAGFQSVARRESYYPAGSAGGPREDALVMRRNLAGSGS